MPRSIERSNWRARWRSEIHLTTGKVLTDFTDWTQSHWDEHKRNRTAAISSAKSEAKKLIDRLGGEVERIVLVEEKENVLQVTETYLSERFDSEHFLEGETK